MTLPSLDYQRGRETGVAAERHHWRSRLEALPRHDYMQVNACYTTDHVMEPALDGEWVRFEHIAALLAERP